MEQKCASSRSEQNVKRGNFEIQNGCYGSASES